MVSLFLSFSGIGELAKVYETFNIGGRLHVQMRREIHLVHYYASMPLHFVQVYNFALRQLRSLVLNP